MGAGIAQVFAGYGYKVTVFEPVDGARRSLRDRVSENLRMLGEDSSVASDIVVTEDFAEAVSIADYVTEAVPEKLELKRAVFADLEKLAPAGAILASNTSVIPISRITKGLSSSHRMVGTVESSLSRAAC